MRWWRPSTWRVKGWTEATVMHIAIVDNYDSFTYNLVQYLSELGARVEVERNDAITATALRDSGQVLSPCG